MKKKMERSLIQLNFNESIFSINYIDYYTIYGEENTRKSGDNFLGYNRNKMIFLKCLGVGAPQ
jgi:hypothetical protein